MDNPIGMMVLIVGVVIVIILMIVLALRNGRQHERLLAEDEEMTNGLLLQRGLDEDLLSQEREHTPRGKQMPRERLNIQQHPLPTLTTLHTTILPAHSPRNPRRADPRPGDISAGS